MAEDRWQMPDEGWEMEDEMRKWASGQGDMGAWGTHLSHGWQGMRVSSMGEGILWGAGVWVGKSGNIWLRGLS